ncbi:hypothetical protein VTN96DRAFT_6595 [Rasamsonia emersonii]|uniref:Prolyl 4-hydroxylase alpha subunit domain-containing protein n=1 Tax=Rasamsonia emersonii (strain ATCC 16479 / CBS 393.64 / IMI 116815) TaxID=1408163 RepID=A0A0F4Z4K8_RASE3|nr:Uncharacterized protein T310_0476 [Rasamsonia emersonii CBS 393.64]KKA25452.1 Uncharacterized protein T310_0476 [Rasamsonia emersonii CBS 393.64]
MPALPGASSIFTWILYLVPLYIFVLSPLLRTIFPSERADGLLGDDDDYDDGQLVPALNTTDDSFISPEDDTPLNCPADEYRVHIFSRTPLVIYIENFLSDQEADHLVAVSEGKYVPSIVYDGVSERVDPSTRLSDRALLERDHVVRCLEERARSFQGWRPNLYIERMWAQRYNVSGHYRHHYDWTGSSRHADRVSTFMVYLNADCTGGGTNFPRLPKPKAPKWCRFIECDGEDEHSQHGGRTDRKQPKPEGVTFKPIKGNAIFWENLRPDGTGYPETWHAALPVESGTKVGLNIWSWYQPPVRRKKGRD